MSKTGKIRLNIQASIQDGVPVRYTAYVWPSDHRPFSQGGEYRVDATNAITTLADKLQSVYGPVSNVEYIWSHADHDYEEALVWDSWRDLVADQIAQIQAQLRSDYRPYDDLEEDLSLDRYAERTPYFTTGPMKKLNESGYGRLAYDLENLPDAQFVKKYGKSKEAMRSKDLKEKKPVTEDTDKLRDQITWLLRHGETGNSMDVSELAYHVNLRLPLGKKVKESALRKWASREPHLQVKGDMIRLRSSSPSGKPNLRVVEASDGLDGKNLVAHLTTTCMSAWYSLTGKFNAKPDIYDIHDDAPNANGKYNVLKMTPGNDVIDGVFEDITKATNALAKALNSSFGKSVFEPRIQRQAGNLETLVAFSGSKGGVLQCRATSHGGDTEVYLTMPVEAELKTAFSAMVEVPAPMGTDAGNLDDPDFKPVAGDPVPQPNQLPLDDDELEDELDQDLGDPAMYGDETPGFDEVPLDDELPRRRFEGYSPQRLKATIDQLTGRLAESTDPREQRALALQLEAAEQTLVADLKTVGARVAEIVAEAKTYDQLPSKELLRLYAEACKAKKRKKKKMHETVENIRLEALGKLLVKRGLMEQEKVFKVKTKGTSTNDEEISTDIAARTPQEAQQKARQKLRDKITAVEEPVESVNEASDCEDKARKRLGRQAAGAVRRQVKAWEEAAANSVGAGGVDMAPDASGVSRPKKREKLPEFVTLKRRGFTGGPFG